MSRRVGNCRRGGFKPQSSTALAARQILEIMQSTSTPCSSSHSQPTNRFFRLPPEIKSHDFEDDRIGEAAVSATLADKARERERQKGLLAVRAGVPIRFEWPAKRQQVLLEPCGNRELDELDGFLPPLDAGAASPDASEASPGGALCEHHRSAAPQPANPHSTDARRSEDRAESGADQVVRLAKERAVGLAKEGVEQKRALAAKAGMPTKFKWPEQRMPVPLEPSGNSAVDCDNAAAAAAATITSSSTQNFPPAKSADAEEAGLPSLAELFKPKAGEWRCGECRSLNTADALTKCRSCEAPRPPVASAGSPRAAAASHSAAAAAAPTAAVRA
jgi:hypothetical protein